MGSGISRLSRSPPGDTPIPPSPKISRGKVGGKGGRARAIPAFQNPRVNRLDVVDVDLLAAGTTLLAALRVTVLVELEAAVAVLIASERVGLVDLGGLGQLAVGLQGSGLVGCVLEAVGCAPGQHGRRCRGVNARIGAGLVGGVVPNNEDKEGKRRGLGTYITSPLSSW